MAYTNSLDIKVLAQGIGRKLPQVGQALVRVQDAVDLVERRLGAITKTTALGATVLNVDAVPDASLDTAQVVLPTFYLVALSVTDNSPAPGSVAWTNGKVSYAGTTYAIADGNTAQTYLIWSTSTPNQITGASSPPTMTGNYLVGLNVAGVFNPVWDKGQINGIQVQDHTLTSTQIANYTITATNIANLTITASQIANATITAAQIANQTITAQQIANLTLTAAQIANLTITAAQIANQSITSTQIANLTIVAGNIANSTITGTQIDSLTITASHIANNTITATQIDNNTITAGQIANLTITASQIANLTITASQIANATITGAKIVNATITSALINDLAVDKITSWSGSTISIASGVTFSATGTITTGIGPTGISTLGNVSADGYLSGATVRIGATTVLNSDLSADLVEVRNTGAYKYGVSGSTVISSTGVVTSSNGLADTTRTVKDGSGNNKTVTIASGIITAWET